MIDRIIEEIFVCLNSNCFLAALSTALTLPDICGKAEYGDIQTTKRYIKWFDKYIGDFENSSSQNADMPYLSGKIVYDLRNNALHAGTFSINGEKQDIQNFELLVQEPNRAILSGSSAQIATYYDGDNVVRKERTLCINITDLILKLCVVAKSYYNENKDKFKFITSSIATVDNQTRQKFQIKEPLLYNETFKLDKDKTTTKWYLI